MLPAAPVGGCGMNIRYAILALPCALMFAACSHDATARDPGPGGSGGADAADAAPDATSACGARDEPCCAGDACGEDLGCTGIGISSAQRRCLPCGHAGERCCPSSPLCADGLSCGVPLLISDPDFPTCVPEREAGLPCITSCVQPGGQFCGRIGTNCGKWLECGECTATGFTCGGAGNPHVCGAPRDGGACAVTMCETSNGQYCGVVGDGCGSTIDCGSCHDGTACGASGTPNLCGSTPDGATPREPPPPVPPTPPPPPNAR